MARQETAKTIINRAAVEVGLSSFTDPFAHTDDNATQLTELLNVACAELVEYHPWQVLRGVFTQTVDLGTNATGIYDLPSDFAYLVNQTIWDKTNDMPAGGPLNPQQWSYLDGTDLVSSSIYTSVRLVENQLYLYPVPPTDGLQIRLEYIKRTWATDTTGVTAKDYVDESTDIVLLDPLLVQKFLKAKYREAKGMESSAARLEFENIFNSRTGKDQGAQILSAGGLRCTYAPLLGISNAPDTGYGAS